MTAPWRTSQPQPSSRVTRSEPTSAVGVRREASDKTRLSDISFPLPDAALPFTFLRWTALRPRRTVRFSPARSLPVNDGCLAHKGSPPALPGWQKQFDVSGSRPPFKVPPREPPRTRRNFDDGRVREPKSHEVGCKYHAVFIPKCRRKTLYGELRWHLGEVF